jgi:hypothetical protein
MTYNEMRNTRASFLAVLLSSIRMPKVGLPWKAPTPVDPARKMSDREVAMYGAGGCMGRFRSE